MVLRMQLGNAVSCDAENAVGCDAENAVGCDGENGVRRGAENAVGCDVENTVGCDGENGVGRDAENEVEISCSHGVYVYYVFLVTTCAPVHMRMCHVFKAEKLRTVARHKLHYFFPFMVTQP